MTTSANLSENLAKSTSAKVLLVEDNLMNQRLTGFMLHNLGIEFDVCGDGKAAIKCLMEKPYALVLMDIEMPVMSGLIAAKEIRTALHLTMPIVALTAYDSDEEIKKCSDAGMNDHLIKPINEEAFLRIINKYLSLTDSV